MTQPDSLPDSHYAAHCREVCEWCRKGFPRYALGRGKEKAHYIPISHRVQMDHSCPADVPCTAPAELDFAEQQARIAEIRRQKLDLAEEALRKRREQIAEIALKLVFLRSRISCLRHQACLDGMTELSEELTALLAVIEPEEHLNG